MVITYLNKWLIDMGGFHADFCKRGTINSIHPVRCCRSAAQILH